MVSTYRIQVQGGPVTDQVLEQILFRAAHSIVTSLAPYPAEQRVALVPNLVRIMLAAFPEEAARVEGSTGRLKGTK
jgi:hypothetical protein